MKKRVALILCVLMIVGLLAACGGSSEPAANGGGGGGDGTFRVANVVAEYNEWNVPFHEVLQEQAAALGWEVEIFDSNQDVNAAINMVNSIIAQEFDAIVIQPPDNAALAPSLIRAAEAGIIVVSLYDYDEADPVAEVIWQVLFGQKESGILQAEMFVAEAGETGVVALIGGLTGADNARLRMEGYRQVLDQYPGIEVVAEIFANWDRQQAMAAAEDILVAHPNLTAFLVQDGMMGLGVWEAIYAAGMQDQVQISSQGFHQACIPSIRDGRFMHCISYPAGFFAIEAIEVIRAVAAGENVPRITVLGMEVVTTENVDTAIYN